MAVLPIYTYDASVLRSKTRTVEKPGPQIIKLALDMLETMKAAHGIGLAANQVGAGHALFVIDLSESEGHKNFQPIIAINPVITDRWGDPIEMEEGCLSIPDVRAEVERPEFIHLRYRDTNFVEKEIEADGLLARVIQHEFDHLQGVFFTDYLKGLKKRLLLPTLAKIKRGDVDAEYPLAAVEHMQVVSS